MAEAGPAARKYDAVTHSLGQAGMIVGAVAGALVGAAALVLIEVFTVGVGTPVAIGLVIATTGIGAAIGKWLGGMVEVKSGKISDGSPTIFYGKEIRNAARITDPLECADPLLEITENPIVQILSPAAFIASKTGLNKMIFGHGGAFVWSGTYNIFCDTDFLLASRIESKTSCGGKVSEGIDTIILFGATVHIADPELASEDLATLFWFFTLLDLAGLFTGIGGLKTAPKIALFLTSLGLKVGGTIARLAGYPQLAANLQRIDAVISTLAGIPGLAGAKNVDDVVGGLKDVVLGPAGQGANELTNPKAMSPKDAADVEKYKRRVRQRITKPWYDTQYGRVPAT